MLFECEVIEEREVLQEAELSGLADSENDLGGSSETMYFIGLDVHKKTISYCVKDAAGRVYQEGKVGSSRRELDVWIRTMPQPRMIAMEESEPNESCRVSSSAPAVYFEECANRFPSSSHFLP